MDAEKDRIIGKIKALLSRDVSRGATEAEAETALAMANKLMDQYKIAHADVDSYSEEEWETDIVAEWDRATMPAEVFPIGSIINEFFHVKTLFFRKTRRKSVKLFGDRADIEVGRWAFVYLSAVFNDLWDRHRFRFRVMPTNKGAFYKGLAAGLAERLRAERKRDQSVSSANALVLVSDRLHTAFDEAYPDLPTVRSRTVTDLDTYMSGVTEGRKINLSRPIQSSAPKGLPSE